MRFSGRTASIYLERSARHRGSSDPRWLKGRRARSTRTTMKAGRTPDEVPPFHRGPDVAPCYLQQAHRQPPCHHHLPDAVPPATPDGYAPQPVPEEDGPCRMMGQSGRGAPRRIFVGAVPGSVICVMMATGDSTAAISPPPTEEQKRKGCGRAHQGQQESL